MASVRAIQNKSGISYKIEVSNGYDKNGKKIRYTTTFVPEKGVNEKQRERQAWIYAAKFEEQMKTQKKSTSDISRSQSLCEFGNLWMELYGNEYLEASTTSRYQLILDNIIYPKLGKERLSELGIYEIESFLLGLRGFGRVDGKQGGYSDGTIFKVKTILSSLFTTAVRWGILKDNPCQHIRITKREKKHDVQCFTPDEAKRFLSYVDEVLVGKGVLQEQYRILFYIAIFCGLRRGELLGLTWENVDLISGKIYVKQTVNRIDGKIIKKEPKTASSIRTVSLPSFFTKLLQDYKHLQDEYKRENVEIMQQENWVFIQKNGNVMSVGSPYAKFRKILNQYNTQIEPEKKLPLIPLHGLRHTNASLLIASGEVDIETVSRKLGHANMATTMRYYVHPYEEAEKASANVLERIFDI